MARTPKRPKVKRNVKKQTAKERPKWLKVPKTVRTNKQLIEWLRKQDKEVRKVAEQHMREEGLLRPGQRVLSVAEVDTFLEIVDRIKRGEPLRAQRPSALTDQRPKKPITKAKL